MDWLYYENLYNDEGKKIVCGIDEAGRGPLAGPVYAAAVVLPFGTVIDGVAKPALVLFTTRVFISAFWFKSNVC